MAVSIPEVIFLSWQNLKWQKVPYKSVKKCHLLYVCNIFQFEITLAAHRDQKVFFNYFSKFLGLTVDPSFSKSLDIKKYIWSGSKIFWALQVSIFVNFFKPFPTKSTFKLLPLLSKLKEANKLCQMIFMPYPCSHFCTDIKFDIRFDNRFDIKLGDSFHVNHTINFVSKLRPYGIV